MGQTLRRDGGRFRVFGSRYRIFRDIDSVHLGMDFRKELGEAIACCHALLVVIGPRWLDPGKPPGGRRIDDPKDFVRIEIEAALARDIPIVPVLVEDAELPAAEQLPESIRELTYRQSIAVRHDPDFLGDMGR